MKSPRPIVTLTSDFGLSDHYVAAMKAAVLRECPEAVLVDVTHQVPPGNILGGSFVLGRAIDAFDAGTIHLAVVDPLVGTDRRLLAANLNGKIVVCPDNGLISWAWLACASPVAAEITWRPAGGISNTFHGRDVMAPVAGRLAAGEEIERLARPISRPVVLPSDPRTIIHIDHYGNAVTNVPGHAVGPAAQIHAAGNNVGRVRQTYADVPSGQWLAIINSSGLLEIAVRDGSASAALGLKVGDEVQLS